MKNSKTVFYRAASEVDNIAAKWSLYYTLALILGVLVFLSPLLVFLNIKTTLAGEVFQYCFQCIPQYFNYCLPRHLLKLWESVVNALQRNKTGMKDW